MRNLKRFLAVLVAIAIIATTMVTAFAADTISADAKICADLGVLKGTTGTVDSAYLAKSTTRIQAAILTLRLLGKEQAALAWTGTANFKDANTLTWLNGRKVMAYLKANPGLGWIGSNDKFDPNGKITATQLYKVLLESLGYRQGVDFLWADVSAFAESKGLKAIKDVASVTNDNVATALVEALKATIADGSKTLVEKLVANGQVPAAAATSLLGFKVVGVTSNNYKEIVVNFNTPALMVDSTNANWSNSALNPANYTISAGTFALAKVDDKSVMITLNTAATVNTSVGVTVSGVKNAAASATAATFTTSYIVADTAAPTATAAVDVSKTLTITFSEPMASVGTVYVAGTAQTVTFTAGAKTATVALGAAYEAGKVYNVSIVGATDLAGKFTSVNPYALSVAIPADSVLPDVVGIESAADGAQIKVTFSEAIIDQGSGNYFTATFKDLAGTTLATSAAVTVVDAKTYTVALPSAAQLSGLSYRFEDVTISGYKDVVGNAGAAKTSRVLFQKDTIGPVLKETKVASNNQSIIVVFDEPIVVATTSAITVEYTGSNGIVYSPETIALGSANAALVAADGTTTTNAALMVAVKVSPTTAGWRNADSTLKAGTYKVSFTAASLADQTAQSNKNLAISTSAQVGTYVASGETTPPTVSVTLSGITITLTSSEDLQAVTAANFKLAGNSLPANTKVYFYNNLQTIKIELPNESIDLAGLRSFEYTVYDLAGNKTTAAINLTFVENVRPYGVTAVLADPNKVVLTFSENIANASAADFEVYVNATKVTVGTPVISGKTVTISFTPAAGLTDTVKVKVLGTGIVDAYGNAVVSGEFTAVR